MFSLRTAFRTACAVALSLALLGPAWPAISAPSSVGGLEGLIGAKRERAAKVRKAMEKMRTDLAAHIAKLDQLTVALDKTRADVEATTKRLAELETALAYQQSQLDALVVRSYKSDGFGFLSVIVGTASFEDFITRVDFLARLGQIDAQIIAEVKEAREESAALKAGLEKREEELTALRAQADEQRARVQAEIVKQQAALHSLDADVAKLVKALERARQAAASGLRWDPTAGGVGWMTARSLLPGSYASIEGRPGETYLIPGGQPTTYRSTGIAWNGVASWYGNAENGTATSSGRPYNENELTCANKTLPLGTLLAVSRGSKRIICVVTDRGPYIPGRDIDLSRAGSLAIGFDGVSPVRAEIVVPVTR